MSKKTKKNVKVNEVMKKIRKGKVKMKPRAYFAVGSMLLGVGVVGLMMMSVILISGAIFRLRMSGAFVHLGPRGLHLGRFARMIPVHILGLSVAGLLGGSILVRKQGRGYRVSLVWLFLGGLVAVMGLGYLIDRSGANERLRRVRPLKPLYEVRVDDIEQVRDLRQEPPRPMMPRDNQNRVRVK